MPGNTPTRPPTAIQKALSTLRQGKSNNQAGGWAMFNLPRPSARTGAPSGPLAHAPRQAGF
eukprot:3586721-Alexandrium_andersonii.AAC.1